MNYKQITDELLNFVDSPSEQFRQRAKSAIKSAQQLIEQRILFKEAECTGVVTYVANEFAIDIGELCGGEIVSLRNAQLLAREQDRVGRPIEIVDYHYVQRSAWEWIQTRGYNFTWEQIESNDLSEGQLEEYRDFVSNVDRFMLFRLGKAFGLFPTPVTDTYLLLNFFRKAETLNGNEDTNFLLQEYNQLILWTAAKVFAGYIKDKSLFEMASVLASEAFDSAIQRTSNLSLFQ